MRRQPFILLSFSSSEKPQKRRKRSHTNDSNASVIWASRVSQTPLQTPIPYFHQWVPRGKKALVAIACKTAHVCFHTRKRVHTRLRQQDRTQRLTRRNRDLPNGAAITTLDTYCTFTNIPGPGLKTANFAAFGPWSGGALEERREPAGQRCAYARRCPEASRPHWAAQTDTAR